MNLLLTISIANLCAAIKRSNTPARLHRPLVDRTERNVAVCLACSRYRPDVGPLQPGDSLHKVTHRSAGNDEIAGETMCLHVSLEAVLHLPRGPIIVLRHANSKHSVVVQLWAVTRFRPPHRSRHGWTGAAVERKSSCILPPAE